MLERFAIPSGTEKLAGYTLGRAKSGLPRVLFLHGAGKGRKERSRGLGDQLLARKVSSVAFDFSGHGESTGELLQSSIAKRVAEAATVANGYTDTGAACVLIGFSMGAQVAIELLRQARVGGLVLFYPGIYSRRAFNLQFGSSFSEAIRKPESWRLANLGPLRRFNGHLLVIAGANDEVVPSEVPEMIIGAAGSAASKRLIVVEGAPHQLLPTLEADAPLYTEVCDQIAKMARG